MKIMAYINSLGGGKANTTSSYHTCWTVRYQLLLEADTHTRNSKCNSVKVYMAWNPFRTRHKNYFSVFCLSMKE